MRNPTRSPCPRFVVRLQRTLAGWSLPALCWASWLCAALPAEAQERVAARSPLELRHRSETRLRYAQATWPRGEPRAGLQNELPFPGWLAGPLQSDQGLLARSFRHAEELGDPEASPSFALETRVADSVDSAQEQLVEWLAGVQSAQKMPSVAELGLELGDAGFAGRSGAGPDTLAWIAFVRGNVAVRLSACDAPSEPKLDLAGLAAAVDQAIRQAPVLGPGVLPRKPEIQVLGVPRAATVAGSNLRLDVVVRDPAQGRPHLQWIVGGPGQGYVEEAEDGAWLLHTTGPGALTLILEATGSTGTWARHELQLTVLDD